MNNPGTLAIERWLHALSTCPASDTGGHRVLFILDNDFGELTTVLYLVLGQPCFHNTRVLASPRLHATNEDALPGRVSLWKTEKDIFEVFGTYRPQVIVLASGYLLPVHRLLTVQGIERIRDYAEREGALLITTDPFLGLISEAAGRPLDDLISIDIPKTANATLIAGRDMGNRLLRTGLAEAERVLRSVPHLYPAPTDRDGIPTSGAGCRNLAFFNEALVLPAEMLRKPSPGDAPADSGDARPCWMFVIALADYQTQCMFEGPEGFAQIVADRIADAVRLGRRAILLGPDELIQALSPILPALDDIVLLRFCSFTRAMSLLLSAEYCFYWNLVSHSIIMQLWNGRPVILLDGGHLARAMPAIRERIVAWYYQGCEPTCLDHKAGLSLPVLREAVSRYEQAPHSVIARYRRAPSPAALLDSLLHAGARPVDSSPPEASSANNAG